MSDAEATSPEPESMALVKRLYASNDALVWAQEFVNTFAGRTVADVESPDALDVGVMVGWFANAMVTAEDHLKRRLAAQIVGYPVTIDIDRIGEVTAVELELGPTGHPVTPIEPETL